MEICLGLKKESPKSPIGLFESRILIRLNSKCKVRKEDMVYKPNVNVYLLIENKQLKGSRMKYQ